MIFNFFINFLLCLLQDGVILDHSPAFDHPGKYPLPGHNAVTGRLFDCTAAVVALLADLGYLQNNLVADLQPVTNL